MKEDVEDVLIGTTIWSGLKDLLDYQLSYQSLKSTQIVDFNFNAK